MTNVLQLVTTLSILCHFPSHFTTNTSWNNSYTHPSSSPQLREMLCCLLQMEGTNSSHPVFWGFYFKAKKIFECTLLVPQQFPDQCLCDRCRRGESGNSAPASLQSDAPTLLSSEGSLTSHSRDSHTL